MPVFLVFKFFYAASARGCCHFCNNCLLAQVEKTPAVIKTGLKKEEAEALKAKLEAGQASTALLATTCPAYPQCLTYLASCSWWQDQLEVDGHGIYDLYTSLCMTMHLQQCSFQAVCHVTSICAPAISNQQKMIQ